MGEHYLCTKCGGELHCSCAAPPTPTDRERQRDFVTVLRDMAHRTEKHKYTIGSYWNAVEEAADEIDALRAREQRLEDAYIREMRHSVTLGQRTERLEAALRELIARGRSYMRYHNEKFYGGAAVGATGLTPALDEADRALAGTTEGRCTCADGGPGSYEGPREDCPVHGRARAIATAGLRLAEMVVEHMNEVGGDRKLWNGERVLLDAARALQALGRKG